MVSHEMIDRDSLCADRDCSVPPSELHISPLNRLVPLLHKALEPGEVDPLRGQIENVPTRLAEQNPVRRTCRLDRPAECRDVHLEHIGGRRRRLVFPQQLHQALGLQDAPRIQYEQAQQRPGAAARNAQQLAPWSSSRGPRNRISIGKAPFWARPGQSATSRRLLTSLRQPGRPA